MIDVLIPIALYEIIPGEVTQAIDIAHRLYIVVSETLSMTTTLQSEPRAYSGICYGNVIRFTHLYSFYLKKIENISHQKHLEGLNKMTYVITEPCINVKDTACVDVCPVDCIHPMSDTPEFDRVDKLFIDPEECIDCGVCEPECPVEAIFAEDDVPEEWGKYIQIDADYFK